MRGAGAAILPALLAAISACSVLTGLDQYELADGATSSGGAGGVGGAGSAGGAGSVSSTTTAMGGESCLDGVDNDMDGAIDCADTADCGGFACMTVPSGGWQGPGLLYAGDPASVPDCPADFPTVIYDGVADPVQEGATCAACACSTPTVTCTPAVLRSYGSISCGGGGNPFSQPPVNTCGQIFTSNNTEAYRALAPTVTASPCNASGGAATFPPPAANVAARVCAADLSAAGCGPQEQRCVPSTVGAPFEGTVCVWSDGDQVCPGDFSVKHLFGQSLEDTRGCTPCTCGNAQATCSATTLVYEDNNCGNLIAMVPNNNTCVIGGQASSIMTMRNSSGTCPPAGGQPTGSVTLGGALTTVCCRQ